jgi:hypothetical protein
MTRLICSRPTPGHSLIVEIEDPRSERDRSSDSLVAELVRRALKDFFKNGPTATVTIAEPEKGAT